MKSGGIIGFPKMTWLDGSIRSLRGNYLQKVSFQSEHAPAGSLTVYLFGHSVIYNFNLLCQHPVIPQYLLFSTSTSYVIREAKAAGAYLVIDR